HNGSTPTIRLSSASVIARPRTSAGLPRRTTGGAISASRHGDCFVAQHAPRNDRPIKVVIARPRTSAVAISSPARRQLRNERCSDSSRQFVGMLQKGGRIALLSGTMGQVGGNCSTSSIARSGESSEQHHTNTFRVLARYLGPKCACLGCTY